MQPPACAHCRTSRRLPLGSAALRAAAPEREVRELDGQQYLRGAVSMTARASLVRACTSSSGSASSRGARSGCRHRRARRRPASSTVSSSGSSSLVTSPNANVSLARPKALRNWSMDPVSCSRGLAISVLPLGGSWSGSGHVAAPIGGRLRDDNPAAAKAPACARNRVEFSPSGPNQLDHLLPELQENRCPRNWDNSTDLAERRVAGRFGSLPQLNTRANSLPLPASTNSLAKRCTSSFNRSTS